MDERMLRLFEEELRHLRETAAEFGRAFPDTARNLDPKAKPFEGTVSDPHIERLLEGVAFLAARVRLKLDAQFPQFTQGLLETLYPDFLAPVPSMAIFQFKPNAGDLPPPEGLVIKREAKIQSISAADPFAAGREPTPCIFSLAHEVRVLPVELAKADWLVRRLHEAGVPREWEAKSALRLRFAKKVDLPWSQIRLDPLVVHVPGGDGLGYRIIQQLFARQIGLVIRTTAESGSTTVYAVRGQPARKFGYDASCALLPVTARGFEGHRLLKEYFALPDRFLFFEVSRFQDSLARCAGGAIELIIALDEAELDLEKHVRDGSFELYCAPAINLFTKLFNQVIEPDRFSEFHLVPDANRTDDFEIYSIEAVEGFSDSRPYGLQFQPFFKTQQLSRDGNAFFNLDRRPRLSSKMANLRGESFEAPYGGSEAFISLVDPEQTPFNGDINQLAVTARLTNRYLPVILAESPVRWLLTGGVKAEVILRTGPSLPQYREVDGPYSWRLLNLLAVNYLALTGSREDGAAALRETLSLYAGKGNAWAEKQIDALKNIQCATIARPLYTVGRDEDDRRLVAIIRGIEVALIFEDSAFLEMSVISLGSVLEEFFARYAAINSFTETVMKTADGRERMRWPARTGLKPLA